MQNHIFDSQAPRWLSGAGKGYHRCSVCDDSVHVNKSTTYTHQSLCWIPYLENLLSSLQSQLSVIQARPQLSISSESSSFELMDDAPSLAMDNSSVSFDIAIEADISDSESNNFATNLGRDDRPSVDINANALSAGFEVTSEDVASFNCTMRQTTTNKLANLKQYTHSFSTEDSSAAMEWMHNESKNGGSFEVEDIPTGSYVKAYFTAEYHNTEHGYYEMNSILVHDTLTTLQTYGVDVSSVKYIAGDDEENGLAYIILPGYCMENTDKYTFRYTHCIESENDLLGFVKKGTPILTKEMCRIIDDAVEEDKRFDCSELLVRRFLYENKEKLINGGTFTIKDMEDAGIIDIYRNIYPEDSKNIKLGKTIGLYCDVKSKANNKVASNQRRKYGLKKDVITYLLD